MGGGAEPSGPTAFWVAGARRTAYCLIVWPSSGGGGPQAAYWKRRPRPWALKSRKRMVSKTSFDIGRRLPLERTLNLLVATTVWVVGFALPGTSRPS